MSNLIVIKIILLTFSIGVYGNICNDQYREFQLDDGYSQFTPPESNIVINDKQKIHDIVKVIIIVVWLISG